MAAPVLSYQIALMKSSFTARWSEALIDENYERWVANPSSVGPDWAAPFFEGFEFGTAKADTEAESGGEGSGDGQFQTRVEGLVYAYRTLGHSIADLDPLDVLIRRIRF